MLLQPGHERVHAHAERDVEGHVAVLDEHVVVAVAAVRDTRARIRGLEPADHAVVAVAARADHLERCARVHERRRRRLGDGHEPHGVAGPQLAELPQLAARDDRRADEPAERGSVGAEDDRGVAREVDRADRVRGVVDVRRVQPRLAAVLARPAGSRADEPDPGACRVVVHAVVGGVEHVDVGAREEVGRRVRALGDADLPRRGERGPAVRRGRAADDPEARARAERGVGGVGVGGSGPQHVAREQRPARVPAEAAERECGRGSEVRGHVDPAAHGQEQAEPGSVGAADRERLPGGDLERLPHRGRFAVDRDRRGRARDRHDGGGRESEHGSVGRDLEAGRALRVADREVRLRERDGIERAARRHADLPVPEPAGQVLHGGHGAGGDHVDARRRIVRLVERGRGVRGGAQLDVVGERPQQADVRDDPVDPRPVERLAEEVERVGAGLARGDDLRRAAGRRRRRPRGRSRSSRRRGSPAPPAARPASRGRSRAGIPSPGPPRRRGPRRRGPPGSTPG